MGSAFSYIYIKGQTESEILETLALSTEEDSEDREIVGVPITENSYLVVDINMTLPTMPERLLDLSKNNIVLSGGFTETCPSSRISAWSNGKEIWRVEYDESDGLYIGGTPPESANQILASVDSEMWAPVLLFKTLTGISPESIGSFISSGSTLRPKNLD